MPVLSYTPTHCDPEILDRLTTARSRRDAVDRLVGAVRDELGRSTHQHQLLIGARGSGKTHVLTLVVHRLRSELDLCDRVLPVVLPEEVVVRQPADLLIRIIERLLAQLDAAHGDSPEGAAALREALRGNLARLRAERDHGQALSLAAAVLEEAAVTLDRLIVPVVENLDALLYAGPGLRRGTAVELQWGLRRALLESRGLILLAAAPTSFGEVTDPKAAFHDFFRNHVLDELSSEEMLALIRERLEIEIAGPVRDVERQRRLLSLKADFGRRAPRLHGLLVLTGGLPRFGHLIFDLLADTDTAEIHRLLSSFLDDQTPYFQSRLDPRLVPEAELEVLDALARAPGPLVTADIADQIRGVTTAAVATCITRLRERGLVRERRLSRRNVRYDLTEPLFRLWRRFRIGPSEQEQILVLAEFVAAMFAPAELLSRAVGSDLGRGGCRAGRGRVSVACGRFEEGIELLVEGFSLERKVGHRHNAEVCGAWALDALAAGLGQVSRDRAASLLDRLSPVIAEVDTAEKIRAALVRLVSTILGDLGPEILLALLPRMEAHLPASHSTLLRPARLAAEVLAGRGATDLPEEPEEVRRAVREFLEKVSSTTTGEGE